MPKLQLRSSALVTSFCSRSRSKLIVPPQACHMTIARIFPHPRWRHITVKNASNFVWEISRKFTGMFEFRFSQILPVNNLQCTWNAHYWERRRDGKHHDNDLFAHFNKFDYVSRFTILIFVLGFGGLAYLRFDTLCTFLVFTPLLTTFPTVQIAVLAFIVLTGVV